MEHRIQWLRHRADEVRKAAQSMRDAETRGVVFRIAELYENMAAHLEALGRAQDRLGACATDRRSTTLLTGICPGSRPAYLFDDLPLLLGPLRIANIWTRNEFDAWIAATLIESRRTDLPPTPEDEIADTPGFVSSEVKHWAGGELSRNSPCSELSWPHWQSGTTVADLHLRNIGASGRSEVCSEQFAVKEAEKVHDPG
jgi:hypothetical protein